MPQIVATMDKRKHERIEKKILVRVSIQENDGGAPQWTIVTSKNISTGGLLFGFNKKLEKGTPLYLRIHFPDQSIDCTATVRRTTPGVYEPLNDVAVSLKGLEKGEQQLIERYVA